MFAVDASGCMVYPATVREVYPDGRLLLDYDLGGSGYERWQNVRPRQVYPHSPRNVPLHLMLRRNVGRGRAPIEGLQVRWHFVANLLQALTAHARREPWRLGGVASEPMHKHYDPKLFDVVTDEEELRLRYAPKRSDDGESLLADADTEA